MNPHELHIRRATVDDLPTLKATWLAMQLPDENLESRLKEFQVVERNGEVAGAIGFQILRTAARLHSEGYADFSVADAARELFWDRIQKLAANHGVFRLWVQEYSPFWLRLGFQLADDETLTRLPDEWKSCEGKWFTLELKNEAVINAALKTQFAGFMASEKKSAEEVTANAKTVTNIITVGFFLIFFICLAVAGWLLAHYRR